MYAWIAGENDVLPVRAWQFAKHLFWDTAPITAGGAARAARLSGQPFGWDNSKSFADNMELNARAMGSKGAALSFLGFNPVQQLLGPTGALNHMAPSQVAYITGRSFFPQLIEEPFASGLHLAFTFAAIATGVAVVASALRGGRPPHATQPVAEELAEGAAETALLADEQVMLDADEQTSG